MPQQIKTLQQQHVVIAEACIKSAEEPRSEYRNQGSVSFARDIKPLFREIDIQHMQDYGVMLDEYSYMSDPTDNHANAVFRQLENKKMPPGGPFWTPQQLDLFSSWMSGGYQP